MRGAWHVEVEKETAKAPAGLAAAVMAVAETAVAETAAVAEEVKRRFTERSLLLCGAEFLSMRQCLEPTGRSQQVPNCDGSKQALMQCMSGRVCEALYSRLQQCTAAVQAGHVDQAQCVQLQAGLDRCMQAAYVSLPEPEQSIDVVEARMRALGASLTVSPGKQ